MTDQMCQLFFNGRSQCTVMVYVVDGVQRSVSYDQTTPTSCVAVRGVYRGALHTPQCFITHVHCIQVCVKQVVYTVTTDWLHLFRVKHPVNLFVALTR